MLLELRLFSLLDLLLDASQRLGCSLVGLGKIDNGARVLLMMVS